MSTSTSAPLQTIPNLVVVKLTGGKANPPVQHGRQHPHGRGPGGTFKTTGPHPPAAGCRYPSRPPVPDSRTPILPGQPVGALEAGGSLTSGCSACSTPTRSEFSGLGQTRHHHDTTAGSFLTVHPTGFGRPGSSSLNWKAGEIRPNLVMMGTDSTGSTPAFYNEASTAVIVDIASWFTR
ncbi:MAG: hypothetical protein R2749_30475 [Acidimicrobiales bacterium]